MRDKQYDKDRRTMHVDASRAIEDAHKRAKDIIERAVLRAQDILLKTEYIKEDIIKNLESNLGDVTDATVKMVRNEALEFNKEYKTLLEEVQVEQVKTLEEVRLSLQDVEYLREDFRNDIQSEVKKVLDETHKNIADQAGKFEDEFAQMLSQTKQEYMSKSEDVLKQLEMIPESEMEEFKTILQKETLSAQKILGDRISELFVEAEKQAAEYKQQRINEVKEQLESVTADVLEEVIGKKLSRQDHEKLVMNALEQISVKGDLTKTNGKAIANQ